MSWPGRRRAVIALAIATLIAALLVPAVIARVVALDPDADRIDAEAARAAMVEHAARQVRRSPAMDRLDDTALELDDGAIRRAVEHALDRDTVVSLLGHAHRQLIERVRGRDNEAVIVDISHARRRVLRAVERALVRTLDRLPGCGVGDDVESVWDAVEGTVTRDSGAEILADLPDCKPVGPLRDRIERGLERRIESLEGDSELVVLERGETSAGTATLSMLDRWFGGWWLALWLAAMIAAGVVAVRATRSLRRVRLALLGLGATWLGVAAIVESQGDRWFRVAADPDTATLGAPLVRGLVEAMAWRLAVFAGAALVAGALWTAAVHLRNRGRTRA